MTTKTYSTSLRAIFTPALDRFTMGQFQGNHHDLFVSFELAGDNLTVNQSWVKNAAGTFINREQRSYSIAAIIAGLKNTAEECGMAFECSYNLPEGFSMATVC
jgi:hypothetical protein